MKLWMLCFVFDMSERMSEDMSESMSKDMSERMSERYVRRYVRKNVRRFAVSRCVFMTEAGSEELKLWSGERCGNIDACLM